MHGFRVLTCTPTIVSTIQTCNSKDDDDAIASQPSNAVARSAVSSDLPSLDPYEVTAVLHDPTDDMLF